MKAYQVTLQIIDFDALGSDGIKEEIERVRWSNDCIAPLISEIKSVDIGEWDDEHPLNKIGCEKLFKDKIEMFGKIEYTTL